MESRIRAIELNVGAAAASVAHARSVPLFVRLEQKHAIEMRQEELAKKQAIQGKAVLSREELEEHARRHDELIQVKKEERERRRQEHLEAFAGDAHVRLLLLKDQKEREEKEA